MAGTLNPTSTVIRGDEDDAYLKIKQPLVSKESNASSSQKDDKQVLVSELSKESPVTEEKECRQRPPWPLLSSPKSPQEASKVGVGNGYRRDEAKRRQEIRYQASPATEWPQRSPIKAEHAQEVASFTLFTQSFDTLSETGNYLQEMDRPEERQHFVESRRRNEPPRKIEVGKHKDSELGDISPIKLDDREAPHEHRDYYYTPRSPPMEFAPRPHYGHEQTPCPPYGGHEYNAPSNPFFVLRSIYKAFDGFTYKLSCLKDRDICPVNISQYASIHHYQDETGAPDRQEVKIAVRRVEAAIHFFGGYLKPKQPSSHQPTSVFRHRKTPSRELYEDHFHQRYVVAGRHISWENEENPPVAPLRNSESANRRDPRNAADYNDDFSSYQHDSKSDSAQDSPNYNGSAAQSENQQKMKYRCKLCGQLKNNHNCPYQQSLQRSIAVMVHPSVNAFTASEPGILTKSLSAMNNFVSYDSEQGFSPEHQRNPISTRITPETKTRLLHSPESSISSHSADPSPNHGQKRSHEHLSQEEPGKKQSLTTLQLRPEHYRAVTPRSKNEEPNPQDYQYPHVPLTFKERKRLSDTLFFLSKEISNVTSDVSALLRGGREKDEWDLAVAEILTQVVVGLYCGEGDHRLDGLQQYLLALGISC